MVFCGFSYCVTGWRSHGKKWKEIIGLNSDLEETVSVKKLDFFADLTLIGIYHFFYSKLLLFFPASFFGCLVQI